MKSDIEEFLAFRKKFTKRQWYELTQAIEHRLNQKADQLVLDDQDIQIISEQLKYF